MTVGTLWLQRRRYPAAYDRRLITALWPDLRVEGGAVTADTSTQELHVAPFEAAIPITDGTTMLVYSDDEEVIPAGPTPEPGHTRTDLLVVRPPDDTIATIPPDPTLELIPGTDGTPGSRWDPASLPPGVAPLAEIEHTENGLGTIWTSTNPVLSVPVPSMPGGGATPGPVDAVAGWQAYKDTSGTVWVSNNNGPWLPATQAFFARRGRSAAFTVPTSAQAFGYDQNISDTYGLQGSGGVVTFPIAGRWRLRHTIAVASTAAGWVQAQILAPTSGGTIIGFTATTAAVFQAQVEHEERVAAGTEWTTAMQASTAMTGSLGFTRFWVSYEGP